MRQLVWQNLLLYRFLFLGFPKSLHNCRTRKNVFTPRESADFIALKRFSIGFMISFSDVFFEQRKTGNQEKEDFSCQKLLYLFLYKRKEDKKFKSILEAKKRNNSLEA